MPQILGRYGPRPGPKAGQDHPTIGPPGANGPADPGIAGPGPCPAGHRGVSGPVGILLSTAKTLSTEDLRETIFVLEREFLDRLLALGKKEGHMDQPPNCV